MVNNQWFFLTTVAASSGDVIQSPHTLGFTGTPLMDYRKISSTLGVKKSLVETVQVWVLTPTAANSTTYTFVISQFNALVGRIVQRELTYVSLPTGDTATTIANAFRSQLLTLQDVQVVGSGTSTLILTAAAGVNCSLFTVVVGTPSNLSLAAGTYTNTTITSSTDVASPVLLVASSAGFAVGQVVTVAGVTTQTNINGTWRVKCVTDSTHVTLDNTGTSSLGAGSNGTITVVPQRNRGILTDIALYVPAAQIPAAVSSTQTFSQITFDWILQLGSTNGMPNYTSNRMTLFINESNAATTGAGTNAAALIVRINELTADYVASATTADPVNQALATENLGGL